MINFKKANLIYNLKIKKHFENLIDKNNLLKKKPHLAISNFFDRYPYTTSIFSLETIFDLGYKGLKLEKNFKYSLDKSQKFAYIFGELCKGKFGINFLELFSLPLSIFKFILRLLFSILDLINTIFYSFFYINFVRDIRYLKKTNQKIYLYTFTYWKNKKINSINYYYPDLKLDKKDYFLATEFCQYRSIYKALKSFNQDKNKNSLTALDYISNKDVIESILLLLDCLLFDFFGKHKYSYSIVVSSILKITSLNRTYLYILNFKCGKHIKRNKLFNKIYIWSENQGDSRMFSMGLMNTEVNNKKNYIISYFGCTSFSSNYHKQFIPNKFELDIGIWGDNIFLLPDKESLDEFKYHLNSKFPLNNFKYKKIRKGLRRFKDNKSILNFNNSAKVRKFTFISHGYQKEFFQVMITLFDPKKNFINLFKDEPIYVRLHPSLEKRKIQMEINLLEKRLNQNFPKLIFIDKETESIIESIQQSEYSIFGDSSLINIALSKNYKVISVRTSFLYKAPIQIIYESKKNLLKI